MMLMYSNIGILDMGNRFLYEVPVELIPTSMVWVASVRDSVMGSATGCTR